MEVVSADNAMPFVLPPRPKIVCLCGSSRFVDIAAVEAWELEKQGVMTLGMHLLPAWYGEGTGKESAHHFAEQEGVARILDELHLRKIEMADEIFVVNVATPECPNGYIGERTQIEIDHALRLGKPVRYYIDPQQEATCQM